MLEGFTLQLTVLKQMGRANLSDGDVQWCSMIAVSGYSKKKSTRPIRLEHSNPKTERGFSVDSVTREQCWELRRNLNSK